jgi:hypothetical protein
MRRECEGGSDVGFGGREDIVRVGDELRDEEGIASADVRRPGGAGAIGLRMSESDIMPRLIRGRLD